MWIRQLFEHKSFTTELKFITRSDITSRVKHEISKPHDLDLQVPHCCETTVFSEACPCLHAYSAAPGQANINNVVQAHVSTVLLEPRVVKTTANGHLIGAQDQVFASDITTWKTVFPQVLLKVQID